MITHAKFQRKGIGHLAYALVAIGIVIIIILLTVILTRNQQLSSQAQTEVSYFDNQPPIPTQSCTVLNVNYQRSTVDISTYSSFVPSNYFQNLSNQYLSEINAKNCPSS
ncbi:MAG TPA: hypothetical protein VN739_07115 [Nitrososphaerales archaeon]|nr:hypothetical protein [Nitrososphaerales archaeon]